MAGKKPDPMSEQDVIEVLKGHRFTFTLENYEQYSAESRKNAEKILKRSEVDVKKGVDALKNHLHEVAEPQYRSVILMRLF